MVLSRLAPHKLWPVREVDQPSRRLALSFCSGLMQTGLCNENAGTYDRLLLVDRDDLLLDEIADLPEGCKVQPWIAPQSDRKRKHLFKSGVARTLAESREGAVDPLAAVQPCGEAVR